MLSFCADSWQICSWEECDCCCLEHPAALIRWAVSPPPRFDLNSFEQVQALLLFVSISLHPWTIIITLVCQRPRPPLTLTRKCLPRWPVPSSTSVVVGLASAVQHIALVTTPLIHLPRRWTPTTISSTPVTVQHFRESLLALPPVPPLPLPLLPPQRPAFIFLSTSRQIRRHWTLTWLKVPITSSSKPVSKNHLDHRWCQQTVDASKSHEIRPLFGM